MLKIATLITMAAVCCLSFAAKKEDRRIVVAKEIVRHSLKDPESARFRGVYINGEDTVCGEVNAKNSMGGYVGFKRFFTIGTERLHIDGDSYVDGTWDKFCSKTPIEISPYHEKSWDDMK